MGVLFSSENLSGDAYLKMLKGTIDPLTTQVKETSVDDSDVQVISEGKEAFQYDGYPVQKVKKKETPLFILIQIIIQK